jgi:hypothetical protein
LTGPSPSQPVGHALSIIGTVANMAGAVLNAMGGLLAHVAFGIWTVSNLIFILYFLGVYRKWWVVNSDSRILVLMYVWFLGTASIGFCRGI